MKISFSKGNIITILQRIFLYFCLFSIPYFSTDHAPKASENRIQRLFGIFLSSPIRSSLDSVLAYIIIIENDFTKKERTIIRFECRAV